MQPLDAFDADHAFMLGLVRQHGGARHIADGIDTGYIGVAQTIGYHATAIGFDPQGFKTEIFNIADNTNCRDQTLGCDLCGRTLFILHAGGDAVSTLFHAQHLGTGQDFDALLFKTFAGQSGNFGVFDRQDLVHHLNNRHIGTHRAIERGKFDTDSA